MRTREKILIAVIVAALMLGGVIVYLLQSNEIEANYTRWLFARNLRQFLSSPIAFVFGSSESGQSVNAWFYGLLGGVGLIVMIVILKMFRDGQLLALQERVHALGAAKQEAEHMLQEEVWKGKTARQAKDSVTRDLEESIERMESMIVELTAKEQALKSRDDELRALKSSVTPAKPIFINGGAGDQALRAEIVRLGEALHARDGEVKELRQQLTGKARLWESQLQTKEDLLNRRAAELEIARRETSELTDQVKELEVTGRRAEALLQKELQNKKEILEASDAANRNIEKRLQETIRNLEEQGGERERVLKNHESEIAALKTQLHLFNLEKEEAESRLETARADLEKERDVKESALKELEVRLGTNIRGLQNQIEERDMLVQVRDGEISSLKSEIHALSTKFDEAKAARDQAETALTRALSKGHDISEESASTVRALEERYSKSLRQLEVQLREKEQFLQVRDGEIQTLTLTVQSLTQKYDESLEARANVERTLNEELRKEKQLRQARESGNKELEVRYTGELKSLQQQVTERDGLLQNRSAEIEALQSQLASLAEQLSKVGSAKERAASLLQEKVRKEKAFLSASDSALRELEANFSSKISALEQQLVERQKLVGSRDAEVSALRAELIAAQQQASEWSAAKEQAEKMLEEAFKEKAALLTTKNSAVQQLQADLLAKQQALKAELSEKEKSLKDRELELQAAKRQLAELDSANDQTVRLFQAEAKEKDDLLRARDQALKELEKRSDDRVRAIEAQLAEKQGLAESRRGEIESLRSKVKDLIGQIDLLSNTKEESVRGLDHELRQRNEALHAKEAELAKVENHFKGQLQVLEAKLTEQQNLTTTREGEVDALMDKVREVSEKYSSLASEKERSDRALQEQLREKTALLEAKESSADDVEERLSGKLEFLERQLMDKQKLLESGGAEMAAMREKITVLHEKLQETEAAKIHTEKLLEEARANGPHLPAVVGSRDDEDVTSDDTNGLDTLLNEREELLKARDNLIQNLMAELKEKKTQLARHEIEVWQGIERRGVWKHRLSKVGIRLKD
jgi:chromosome segregation ATPase